MFFLLVYSLYKYQPAGILKPITLSVLIHCQPARTEHFPVATLVVRTTEMLQDVPLANGLAASCALFPSVKVCTSVGVLVDTTYNGECSMEQGDSTY